MGIQDRDYYREGPSFLDRVSAQGATVWLIAITCGVFVGQMFSRMDQSPLTLYGRFDTTKILEGEVWRLLTSVFLHGGIIHIFFNMLVLYFVGQRLEEEYGSFEFVMMYLCGGLFAGLFKLGLQVVELAAPSFAVGASGAVMAVLIVYAFHWPHQRVLFFFVIPMPMWMLALLFVGLDAIGAFHVEVLKGGPGPLGPIGHLAHLGGAFFGLLYDQSGFQFRKLFARRQKAPVRPKLRVVVPPAEEEVPEPVGAPVQAAPRAGEAADEQLEAKLDAVLEKVSKYGQESLTPEEREILFRASELYKKRRK
jgi:membrane associated rhomboid family serine protease